MMRISLSGLAVALLAACGSAPVPPAPPAAAKAPSEQLRYLVDRYEDDYRALNPWPLPQGAAARFDSGNGLDISPQFLADSLDLERRYLAAAEALPRARLPGDEQLTYDLFRRERELAVDSFTYPAELLPVNPYRSVPLEFARMGAGEGPYAVLNAEDFDSWQRRADAYMRWTDQAIANMRNGMRRGYTEPRVLVAAMLPILGTLAEDVSTNVLYGALRSIPPTLSEGERKRLAAGVSLGVKSKILPAYRLLRDFLRDEYLPQARTSVGLTALPLGDDWYAFLVRRESGSRLTPAELHAIGVAEADRLRARLQTLLTEAGFDGTPQAFFEAMHREPRTALKSSEELLGFYDRLKVEAAAAIPMLFAATPQGDFAIRRLETFRETTTPALTYQRALNRTSAAVLYVNTAGIKAQPVAPDIPRFLREAIPGYHYQISLQEERSDLPRSRRRAGDPAFVEGWGMYAETLGEPLGVYRDTESKFGALSDQLECYVGMVVDTGVNALGWTRDRAIDYAHSQLPIGAAEASELVDRTVALPAQALACPLGLRALRALRDRAEQSLGARFDPRAFHTEVLEDGALPLDLLEPKLNRWLAGLH